MPVTCTAATPFAPGPHDIRLAANVTAAAPCLAASTTPPAITTVTVNPAPTLTLLVQSVNTPCPTHNATAVFAFNVTGLTAGAGALVLNASALSSVAGVACTVLEVTQTGAVACLQMWPCRFAVSAGARLGAVSCCY